MDGYLWAKSLHIIAIIAWMAGLFYLPRLFVNLAMVPADSHAERERLLLMARKLYRFSSLLMVPALVLGLVSRRGEDTAREYVFRHFRRQHLEKFLPGLRKLGLADVPVGRRGGKGQKVVKRGGVVQGQKTMVDALAPAAAAVKAVAGGSLGQALDAAATACEPTLALRQRHGHRSLVGGSCPPRDPAVLRAVEAEGGARRGTAVTTAAARALGAAFAHGASGLGAPAAVAAGTAGRRNATSARAPALALWSTLPVTAAARASRSIWG